MSRFDARDERTRRVLAAIERAGGRPGAPFPCPYLDGRSARHLALRLEPPVPGVYHALMDLNFRRLGEVYYRPECDACDACRMIRVPVAEFRPSRAQRRCLRLNRDVQVAIGEPSAGDEKQELYRRYLEARHDGQMDGSPAEMHGFLYRSRLETLEATYTLDGRIVAVGIVDVEPRALSAVYCYFDPALPGRSLGVLNVLTLLDACRRLGRPHLYLGYYVAGCRRMSYKAGYRPSEILDPEQGFVRHGAAP